MGFYVAKPMSRQLNIQSIMDYLQVCLYLSYLVNSMNTRLPIGSAQPTPFSYTSSEVYAGDVCKKRQCSQRSRSLQLRNFGLKVVLSNMPITP